MHKKLSASEAVALLMNDDHDHWSWSGAQALVEYLEELESSDGKGIEFDGIAIRCDFCEYPSALEAAEDHGFSISENENDEDEIEAAALAYLENRTTVISFENGVIIHQF